MAAPYIDITNGTTTIVLCNGVNPPGNFRLHWQGYVPAIGGINRNVLGAPYARVVDEFDIRMEGSNRSVILANIQTLAQMFEQARQWERGEHVDRVLFRYSANGNSANVRQAIVYGPANDDEGAIEAPSRFTDVDDLVELNRVRVSFIREGRFWLPAGERDLAAPETSGVVRLINLTPIASGDAGPTQWELTGITTAADGDVALAGIDGGFLIVCPRRASGAAIVQFDAESFATSSLLDITTSTVADAANLAQNNNVFRLTAGASVGQAQFSYNVATLGATTWERARMVQVFMTVRNNTLGAVWEWFNCTFSRDLLTAGSAFVGNEFVRIPATTTQPRILASPPFEIPYGADTLTVAFRELQPGAGATLDIDSIWAVDLSHPDARIIQFDEYNQNFASPWPFGAAAFVPRVDPINAERRYVYAAVAGTDFAPLSWRGNAETSLTNVVNLSATYITTVNQYWQLPTTTTSGVRRSFAIEPIVYAGTAVPL